MTREETDALIQRLEAVARVNPRGYPFRVGLMAALGYGYLFGVLAVALLLSAGVVYMILRHPNAGMVKLAIVVAVLCGGLAFAIVKALRVRLEAPRGLTLTPEQVPELFAALEDIHRRLRSVRAHEVLLVGDLNAAVVQVPRLGVFGWQRNYLMLGLPLMQALAPDEFRAVLAHEFAHLSGNHSRFGAWIYRVRRTWERVFEELARQQNGGGVVLKPFLEWYWPKFNCHAFVLARANEYEADACAAELAGPGPAARALMRIKVLADQLDETFWPGIYKQANDKAEPPEGVFAAAGRCLRAGPGPDTAARWLKQAFLIQTNNLDTHPCLQDRLRALRALPAGVEQGVFPNTLPPLTDQTAAEFFLGPQLETLCTRLTQEWREAIGPAWKGRHEDARKLAERLQKAAPADGGEASLEQLWDRAVALIDLEGDEAAVPLLEQILARAPGHPAANFVRGRHLLTADDPRGIEFVERALAEDETLVGDGCNLLYGHYNRTGQRHKLRELEHRHDQNQEILARAQAERSRLVAANNFLPHELPPDTLAKLIGLFAAEPEIGSVQVVRKAVEHLPKLPCYVVCVRLNVSWWSFRGSTANQKLVQRLIETIVLPGQCLVFVVEGHTKSIARKIDKVAGAEVYRRG